MRSHVACRGCEERTLRAIRFRSSLCTCPTYLGQCGDRCSTSYRHRFCSFYVDHHWGSPRRFLETSMI
eukprot:s109_g42.t1